MKKILLLGGSTQQIPAIIHAQKLGYFTVLCDFLPDNPGQYQSDEFHLASTTDKEAILQIAKMEGISGIVSYASDPAAPTAAFVAEALGLPTSPYSSVELLSTKDKFREFLALHGFCVPKAKGYDAIESAMEDIGSFGFPAIVKPVDSSGSKGVSKIESTDSLEAKLSNAMSYSRSKRIIIEEYVDKRGYQVAGDGFSVNGELVFRCFGNDHFEAGGLNPYVPISASFPYNMPGALQEKIHAEIQRLLRLLEMGSGAYNFDIRIDCDENVYLMEIGPRSGGNFIPQVIKYATGVDMIDYVIKAAMGDDCSSIKMREPKGFWSYYAIHSPQGGILHNIIIREDVRENCVVEAHLNYKIGDRVPAFLGSNSCIGILIMKFDSLDQMLFLMDRSETWIDVVVCSG